jgi:hypothetical protein
MNGDHGHTPQPPVAPRRAPGPDPRPGARRAPDPVDEPRPSRVRRLIALGAELFVSVTAALIFFFVFLGGLAVIMPSGISLRSVVGSASFEGRGDGDRGGPMSGSLDSLTGYSPLSGGPAATLAVLNDEVKRKGTSEIVWGSVRSWATLRDGDAVQTTRDGTALLRFGRGEEFQLGRNSLMVVRSGRQHQDASTVHSSVLVLDGDLWADVARGSRPQQVSVATPTATVEVGAGVGPASGGGVKVTVGRDRTSTISVYHGSVDLVAGGRRIRVGASQYVKVDSTSVMSAPQPLPDAPGLTAPGHESRYDYRELPPQVRFAWDPVAGAESYRLVVSRTPDFHKVLLDRQVPGTSFTLGNLQEGSYSWRVSVFHAGVEGPPSEPRMVRIARHASPPALQVTFPSDVVNDDECTIAGVAEPGSRVFVAGESVLPGDSGVFEHRVRLKRGFNVLVVETIDRVGNATYRSKVVEAKF